MYGARTAIEGGLSQIQTQVTAIESAVTDNPGLAFDLARTLVESACKRILRERNVAFSEGEDVPGLFRIVTQHVPLLPATANNEAEARQSLVRTLNGLNTALQGVCELRNTYGFASHGSDGSRSSLEMAQAVLAAQAADSIVGFLYRVHRQGAQPSPRIQYSGDSDFDKYIDELYDLVQIFGMAYRPSEVLFSVDRSAYEDRLAAFLERASDVADTEDS